MALDGLLVTNNLSINHTIEFVVDDNAMARRISGRFVCSKCGEGYHVDFRKPKDDIDPRQLPVLDELIKPDSLHQITLILFAST